MEPRSLKFVADACAGELRRGSASGLVNRVCTDSRQARTGDLFVALAGERFDGHDFLAEVAQKGASAVVVERRKLERGDALPASVAVIAVDSSRQSLGRFAARYRQDFSLPIAAVGGSNGKTTTKELLAAVLRQRFKTLWSEASFNNDIGVPLTLLKLEQTHQAAVLEVGTNHPGELAPLVRMIQPQYGLVTSLGREHLEFFGDLAGVTQEEGWLAELLPASGMLFVNGDSAWMEAVVKRSRARVVRVGFSEASDWRARDLRVDESGVTFRVDSTRAGYAGLYHTRLHGRHQAVNALFSLAVGAEVGLGREELQQGLADCQPPEMRLQLWEANGVQVLDDTYNANADSMLAALQTLRDLPCTGRRIAVLGDMAELGAQSDAAHAETGRGAVECGIDELIAVGQMSRVMAAAARAAGLRQVHEYTDVAEAGPALKRAVKPGDLVLIKASRATGLDRVSQALRGR